jgi:DNA invertase Pin-like site-specific DNA recombinase
MKQDFQQEALLWFSHMLDATIGDKPESIVDYHFFFDEVKREFVKMVYDKLGQQYEQTKLTADFFGIGRKTVYRYTKSKSRK